MTTMSAPRKIRQRPDLHTTTAVEREINDLAAEDLYEQVLFQCIRAGTDPNAAEVIEPYEGYVEPSYDPVVGAEVGARHRRRLRRLQHEREAVVQRLRRSPAHQRLPPFERLLIETEYYTGTREWVEAERAEEEEREKEKEKEKERETDPAGAPARPVRAHLTPPTRWRDDAAVPPTFADPALPQLRDTPAYLRGRLRPYQLEGVNWLLGLCGRGGNGILADEMGLGKTFQTIALLAYLKFSLGLPGPHLVVCPKSVMGSWYREFRQWCPALRVYRLHAAGGVRPMLVRAHLHPPDQLRHDVIVTTFEMVLEEVASFKKIHWRYLVVDEAHKIKNEESRAHVLLNSLETDHRLIITGTPLQNNLRELWSLLQFLAPKLFEASAGTVGEWFDSVSGRQDSAVMSNLHRILAPMMLRRLKEDVSTGIPPKKEIYVSCKLTKKQREWYIHVLAKDSDALNRASSSTSYLNCILMSLRKVINHPYLMDGGEEGPPFITDEKLVTSSGKMIILDKLLRRLREDRAGEHKVLIFSQFTTMLNILEDYANMRGFRYCRIDGNTSSYDRDAQMANFNAPNGETFLFLLSTRAGGLGINLQAANHVILYDSDWNPQMDLQAQDRAHRIGQKRSVRVYRFVTDGTVEERMYQRALKKLYLNALVVQQGSRLTTTPAAASSAASRGELLSMIRFGAEEIFRAGQVEVTEADIDRLLDEGAHRADELNETLRKQVQLSLSSFELGAEEANLYEFEGVSFRSGVESRVLHVRLPGNVSQLALQQQCAAYGEVVRVILHPNLTEALVQFRSLSGALDAKAGLPYPSEFASRENQAVVSSEMIVEGLGGGEKLGRGHRTRTTLTHFDAAGEDPANPLNHAANGNPSSPGKAPPPRLPHAPQWPYFQLFNVRRLTELHNLEVGCILRNWERRQAIKSSRTNPNSGNNERQSNEETNNNNNESASDGELGLSAAEQEERERLLSEGFPNWTYSEYRQLKKLLLSGAFHVQDYAALAEALASPTKTVEAVRDYVVALLERGEHCIPKFADFERRLGKAQKRFQAHQDLLRAAKWKVEQYEDPARQISFLRTRASCMASGLEREIFWLWYESGFKEEGIGERIRRLPQHAFNVWHHTRPDGYYRRLLTRILLAVKREWERLTEVEEMGTAGKPRRARTETTTT